MLRQLKQAASETMQTNLTGCAASPAVQGGEGYRGR